MMSAGAAAGLAVLGLLYFLLFQRHGYAAIASGGLSVLSLLQAGTALAVTHGALLAVIALLAFGLALGLRGIAAGGGARRVLMFGASLSLVQAIAVVAAPVMLGMLGALGAFAARERHIRRAVGRVLLLAFAPLSAALLLHVSAIAGLFDAGAAVARTLPTPVAPQILHDTQLWHRMALSFAVAPPLLPSLAPELSGAVGMSPKAAFLTAGAVLLSAVMLAACGAGGHPVVWLAVAAPFAPVLIAHWPPGTWRTRDALLGAMLSALLSWPVLLTVLQ
ncbi:MAG: hypothetical protein GC166_05705 [Alphaproteobacteria bacterium]|nr:hypothetical protein [Alphaproteobacteria bacterium]